MAVETLEHPRFAANRAEIAGKPTLVNSDMVQVLQDWEDTAWRRRGC